MNRRGFLGAILAACAAPAVVKASSIMRISPDRGIWLLNQDAVMFRDGTVVTGFDLGRADGDMTVAVRIARDGQIGMVDRFSIIETKNLLVCRDLLAAVERDCYDNMAKAQTPMVWYDEAAEIPYMDLKPWKVWALKDDPTRMMVQTIEPAEMFWGPGVPELMRGKS